MTVHATDADYMQIPPRRAASVVLVIGPTIGAASCTSPSQRIRPRVGIHEMLMARTRGLNASHAASSTRMTGALATGRHVVPNDGRIVIALSRS